MIDGGEEASWLGITLTLTEGIYVGIIVGLILCLTLGIPLGTTLVLDDGFVVGELLGDDDGIEEGASHPGINTSTMNLSLSLNDIRLIVTSDPELDPINCISPCSEYGPFTQYTLFVPIASTSL